MTVLETIQKRESIRKYENRPLDPETLSKILEAGRLAPTAANSQATKVVVVQDKTRLQALVPACNNQAFVGTAAAVLAVCSSSKRTMACGQVAGSIDCSIALSFMMLEAAACGVGSCWIGAFDAQKVAEVLSIPEEYTVVALAPFGYPAEEGRHVAYKPMKEFRVEEHFEAGAFSN